ncbi:hypothetical protein GCM10009867_04730 [Pedococcus aerophilus]|uniref:Ig-like domain-containing protein n=1 Tax=Pedococcus aerophilus TaxID=436356 RepID=A0ABP6GU92_9MICO
MLVLFAGSAPAWADDIVNNLDATIDSAAEVMSLTVGGASGSTVLRVVTTDSDGKNGCNLTGQTTATFTVRSSSPAVATVSPSTVTFTTCGETKALTLSAVAAGSTSVSLVQTQNNSQGTFNVAPATFTVNVASAAPSNTAPTVNVVGAVSGQHYTWGTQPSPTCSVNDKEDGATTFAATLNHPESTWIGPQTATCSYTDAGGLTASSSVTYTVDKAQAVITLDCPTSVTFSGSAQTPCTATVTGTGGLDQPLTVTYANNINAGTATASASYAGDATHTAVGTQSTSFAINKAASQTKLDCLTGVVFSGTAQDICTAHVTGVAGLDQSVPVVYAPDNTNATSAGTATATFTGDANHTGSNAQATFEIGKATSVITISCTAGSVFDTTAKTPCTAVVTGAGGLDRPVAVNYTDNVHAGQATVTASYAGDDNHGSTDATDHFDIAKAATTTTLTCPEQVTYDGTSQTPCTAHVTGPGLDSALAPTYSEDTVNAGVVPVTADYAGGSDYLASSDAAQFTIAQAPSSVTVNCPTSLTYTASALTPCTSTVSGAGTFETTSTTLEYANNVAAGTATVTATYGGDRNHSSSNGSGTFTIDKAPTTTKVTCTLPATYTGSPLTPCSAKVTGAGTLDQAMDVSYVNNINAGTGTASASYAGDANHTASMDTATFTIDRAASAVAVSCPTSVDATGSAITPCTAQVTGPGALNQTLPVSYTGNTLAGTAMATATWAGDANHTGSTGSATFKINPFRLGGFYQPVDMNGVLNTVKAGSTVPLKFELFSGSTELTSTTAVKSFSAVSVNCSTTATVDDVEVTTTGGTSLRYDTTGGQFIQNWQTPKTVGACIKVTMTAADGSALNALFKLK